VTLTGGTVTFNSTVDDGAGGPWDLTVNATTTAFHGRVGNGQALDVLQTDADGTTTIDTDVVTGATLDFNDAVVIDVDTALTGTTSVDFAGTVDSQAAETNDLTVNSPTTAFHGNVGSTDLITDAPGTTTVTQNVSATTLIRFQDPVTLDGVADQTIDAVAGTLDADGTLTKTGAGKLTLGGGTAIDLEGTVDVQGGELEIQDAFSAAAGRWTPTAR